MILSSADIQRILGGDPVIRQEARISIVDTKPGLGLDEYVYIYIERYPTVDEFEATWRIWVQNGGSDVLDLVLAALTRLLPKFELQADGLYSTTDFKSDRTVVRPAEEIALERVAQATGTIEQRFVALEKTVLARLATVRDGIDGQDGLNGLPGAPGASGRDGRDGRDLDATETNLEDLQNVEQNIAKQDGQVLTWKDGAWQNLFIPQIVSSISASGGGAQKLDDLTDVEAPTPQEGQALVWNETTQLWEPADVSNGSLIANGEWRFSDQVNGTPSSGYIFFNNADPTLVTEVYIHEINNNGKDVGVFLQSLIKPSSRLYIQDSRDSDNAALYTVIANPVDNGAFKTILVSYDASQGTIANNKICGVSILGGGGGAGSVSVLDDLLDVDTTTTLPQVGDILEFDGSQWVPAANTGSGIEEAPLDGKFYVRQSGAWVDLETALQNVTTADTNVDGADFTQQVTTAQNNTIYDGGNFTLGQYNGNTPANTFLDGGEFAAIFDDTLVDGGTASV